MRPKAPRRPPPPANRRNGKPTSRHPQPARSAPAYPASTPPPTPPAPPPTPPRQRPGPELRTPRQPPPPPSPPPPHTPRPKPRPEQVPHPRTPQLPTPPPHRPHTPSRQPSPTHGWNQQARPRIDQRTNPPPRTPSNPPTPHRRRDQHPHRAPQPAAVDTRPADAATAGPNHTDHHRPASNHLDQPDHRTRSPHRATHLRHYRTRARPDRPARLHHHPPRPPDHHPRPRRVSHGAQETAETPMPAPPATRHRRRTPCHHTGRRHRPRDSPPGPRPSANQSPPRSPGAPPASSAPPTANTRSRPDEPASPTPPPPLRPPRSTASHGPQRRATLWTATPHSSTTGPHARPHGTGPGRPAVHQAVGGIGAAERADRVGGHQARWQDARVELRRQYTDRFDHESKLQTVRDRLERSLDRLTASDGPDAQISAAGRDRVWEMLDDQVQTAFETEFGGGHTGWNRTQDHVGAFEPRIRAFEASLPIASIARRSGRPGGPVAGPVRQRLRRAPGGSRAAELLGQAADQARRRLGLERVRAAGAGRLRPGVHRRDAGRRQPVDG